MIKFSVITVCLNAGNYLHETIKSTLMQTYRNFEIIVKDGYSTDDSIENISNDARIRLIQKKDTGIYDAMNQGIDAATGDYLVFMNAGDLFYANTVLQEVAEKIEKNRYDLYYGRCYNRLLDVVDPAPSKLTKYFCYRSMICHQATFYSRAMLKNRGYDISYHVSADRERMLHAIIREKVSSEYLSTIIVSFQGGGFCTTDKAKKLLIDEQKRMKKAYFSKPERVRYVIAHEITLPHIREKVLKNPKIKKTYRTLIAKIYRN